MRINEISGYICAILAVAVLLLQAVYYLSGLVYTSTIYFFVLVMVLGAATIYSIFFHSSNLFLVCFMILSTATFMNMTYVYYSIGFPYIPPLDAIYHWKTAESITATSSISLIESTHIEFEYSSYPGFHLFISLVTQVTGFDSILFVKIIPLVYALLPFLVFLIVRKIFPAHNIAAALAAYVTIFLPKWYAFPSYSRFVIIYLLLLFYFLIGLTTTQKRGHFVLALISIAALSFTHHITTYITLFFLVFAVVFSVIVKQLKFSRLPIFKNMTGDTISSKALAGLIVCGTLFPVFASPIAFEYHFTSFLRYFSPQYVPEEFSRNMMGFYTRIEQTLILAAIGLVGLVGLYGFMRYLRRDRWVVTTVAFTVFFGSVFALSIPSLYTNPTVYNYVSGRMIFLLFLVISPFIGIALAIRHHSRLKRRIHLLGATLLLLSLTFASVDLIPRDYYYFSQEKDISHLWAVRENGESLYSSLIWVSENTVKSNWSAVGDVPLVYLGNGMLNLSMQHYWPLFEEPFNGNEHFSELTRMNISYVFLDTLLTKYREQRDYKRFIGPVSAANLTLVNEYIWANRIYDNEIVSIIHVSEDGPVG